MSIAQDAARSGIFYMEFIKHFHPSYEVAQGLKSLLLEVEKKTGVTIRIRISDWRGHKDAKKIQTVKGWTQLKDLDASFPIVGFDLVGDETNATSREDHPPVLRELDHSSILKASLHAGEFGHPDNVRDSILLGAHRIGHAVTLETDLVTQEFMVKKQIPIEINLYSNKILNAKRDLTTHPFLKYFRIGIPTVLTTDDDGMLHTHPNNECEQAILNSDIQYSELKKMYENSINAAFVEESKKKELQARLEAELKAFENSSLMIRLKKLKK